MFSLQPRDELVFGSPSDSRQDKILSDLIVDHAYEETNHINFRSKSDQRKLGQREKLGCRRKQTEGRDDCSVRKVMRREIERRRRQDMSSLYASLRSLVPLDHLKGKKSMCDQMQEAVTYIKQMQQNVEELRIRRDKLKKLSNLSGRRVGSSDDSDNLPKCVTVNLVSNGVEILITDSFESSELGLSRILAELLQKELDVVSCVSTRTKGRFLHNIQAEARDMASFDVSVLQERLINATK